MVIPAERARLRAAGEKYRQGGPYIFFADAVSHYAIPLLDDLEAAEAEIARLKADLAKVGSPVGWGDHLK